MLGAAGAAGVVATKSLSRSATANRLFGDDAFASNGSALTTESSTFDDDYGRCSTSSISSYRASTVMERSRRSASAVMRSSWFDAAVGAVIIANAVFTGWEQSRDMEGGDIAIFSTAEHVFLAIYIIELMIRFLAQGRACLADNWVRFDLVLVCASVLCFWIIFPVAGKIEQLEVFVMLRMLRLLRLARAVRLVWLFRELWMLVHGLLVSGKTIVYTVILIAITLYLFAVLAIEVIANNQLAIGPNYDEEFAEHVHRYFRNLPITMMTLMQFVSFDNVVLVYEPLVSRDWRLAVFFVSIIVLVGILLMNLVTAVVVNSALEQASSDKELMQKEEEKRKKRMLRELRKVFHRLDEDGSGQVTAEEIANITDKDRELLVNMLGISDPLQLFGTLDVDDSGEVDIDEFCLGVWQVCTSKAPIELQRVEKIVDGVRKHVHELRGSMKVVNQVHEQLAAFQRSMADMRQELRDLKCGDCAVDEMRRELRELKSIESTGTCATRLDSAPEEEISFARQITEHEWSDSGVELHAPRAPAPYASGASCSRVLSLGEDTTQL